MLYETLVQSIILYNSETWILKEHQKRKLRVFELPVLRKICGITRKDEKRNVDILKELSVEKDIVDLLDRMGNNRFPKLLLHGYAHGP